MKAVLPSVLRLRKLEMVAFPGVRIAESHYLLCNLYIFQLLIAAIMVKIRQGLRCQSVDEF